MEMKKGKRGLPPYPPDLFAERVKTPEGKKLEIRVFPFRQANWLYATELAKIAQEVFGENLVAFAVVGGTLFGYEGVPVKAKVFLYGGTVGGVKEKLKVFPAPPDLDLLILLKQKDPQAEERFFELAAKKADELMKEKLLPFNPLDDTRRMIVSLKDINAAEALAHSLHELKPKYFLIGDMERVLKELKAHGLLEEFKKACKVEAQEYSNKLRAICSWKARKYFGPVSRLLRRWISEGKLPAEAEETLQEFILDHKRKMSDEELRQIMRKMEHFDEIITKATVNPEVARAMLVLLQKLRGLNVSREDRQLAALTLALSALNLMEEAGKNIRMIARRLRY